MKTEIKINNGKYKMIKKLGAGRFSVCWECELTKESSASPEATVIIGGSDLKKPNKKFVQVLQTVEDNLKENEIMEVPASKESFAVKIQKNKKDYLDMARDEIKFYTLLQDSKNKSDNLLELKDHFTERGGDICMVFNKMDKTLLELIEESKTGLSLPVVKSIMKQILDGIACLHKNGIIHTDLKPENILLKELGPDNYKVCIGDLGSACLNKEVLRRYKLQKQKVIERYEELVEDFKVVKYIQLIKKDADTRTMPETQELLRLDKNKTIKEFKLLDKTDEVKELKELENRIMDSIGTTEYKSIESIIGADYTISTDIWSIACIMFESLTNDYLFDPHSFCDDISSRDSDSDSDNDIEMSSDSEDSDNSEGHNRSDSEGSESSEIKDDENKLLIDQMHLWLMTRTLGEIPKYVSRRGDFAKDFFNNAGNIKRMPQFLKEKSISYTLTYDYNFDKEIADEIEKFMLPMLAYDAEKRISAEKALESPFLNN